MRAILLAIILLIVGAGELVAQSLEGAPIDPERNRNPDSAVRPNDEELLLAPKNRYMVTMSAPGDRSLKYGCSVVFSFDDKTGQIEDIHLLRSSGKPEVDFDCICALLGSAPYEANERGNHRDIHYTFGGCELPKGDEGIKGINRAQRRNLLTTLAQRGWLPSDYFTCNLIPVSILYRYPGLFSDSELCDCKNLRLIPKAFFAKKNEPTFKMIASNKRLRSFYKRWYQFVRTNPKTTREEIEKYRDGVDAEFADMFSHPRQTPPRQGELSVSY